MELETLTTAMQRLRGGPLLSVILNKFKIKSSNLELPRKMILYSGHDAVLVAVKNCLNLHQPTHPPYAAALILELHKHSDYNDSYVEVFLSMY
jgi:hypothetical protein